MSQPDYAEMIVALHEVAEYLDNRADIAAETDGHGGVVPNEEMRLLATVRRALGEER